MCGITGLLLNRADTAISRKLLAMNATIVHRGPDADGYYCKDDRIAMAMRRLSIIDIVHGHQPMYSEDREIVIVFNGEIYNYRELKTKEEGKGIHFKTNSDTEVVLRLYQQYGEACLQYLNGMFAFSIHDLKKQKLFIARDRFGEKPLYYSHNGDRFVWGSELKSIIKEFPELKEINADAVSLYLSLTYIPAPHTIYRSIHKLKAGHFLVVNTESLEVNEYTYWNTPMTADQGVSSDYRSAQKKLRELLFESVEQRMVADVPLGVFLSGGIDSAIVAAIMSKISGTTINTFTVGYQNKMYDESGRASQLAAHIGAKQHVFTLEHGDMLQTMDRVILNYDEPFADSSALPTFFIASKAVKDVTVALTGDGGDEVFGGYNKYQSLRYQKWIKRYIPGFVHQKLTDPSFLEKYLGGGNSKSLLTKARRFLSSVEGDTQLNHLNIMALGFKQYELDKLVRSNDLLPYKSILLDDLNAADFSELQDLKLLRYLDKEISLEGDMLVKVDRASMLCSLECRAPFLDHRLMEMTYTWPDSFLIKGGVRKRILRETFADLVPKGFFDARKSGFEVPVGQWLREELREELVALLTPANLETHGLFNSDYVQEMLRGHLQATGDHSWKLWTLFCFQKWYQHNFN